MRVVDDKRKCTIYTCNELISVSNVTELIRVEKEFQHIVHSLFLMSSYHIPITFMSSEKVMVSKVEKELALIM